MGGQERGKLGWEGGEPQMWEPPVRAFLPALSSSRPGHPGGRPVAQEGAGGGGGRWKQLRGLQVRLVPGAEQGECSPGPE